MPCLSRSLQHLSVHGSETCERSLGLLPRRRKLAGMSRSCRAPSQMPLLLTSACLAAGLLGVANRARRVNTKAGIWEGRDRARRCPRACVGRKEPEERFRTSRCVHAEVLQVTETKRAITGSRNRLSLSSAIVPTPLSASFFRQERTRSRQPEDRCLNALSGPASRESPLIARRSGWPSPLRGRLRERRHRSRFLPKPPLRLGTVIRFGIARRRPVDRSRSRSDSVRKSPRR